MDSATNFDLLKGIGNTALNAATFSFPGSDSFTPYFSYSNQTIGGICELYGLGGLGELATSSLSNTASTPISDTVLAAQQRQAAMLDANTGFNVSPTSWDSYPSIGRNGTYITDRQAITGITGSLNLGGETSITSSQAAQLEQAMGLQPGSLANGFKVRQVDGITGMSPQSPLEGNQYFQGGGQHLPGGGPEMVIEPISTTDSGNVKTITTVKVK
jgi:hypothetical protein